MRAVVRVGRGAGSAAGPGVTAFSRGIYGTNLPQEFVPFQRQLQLVRLARGSQHLIGRRHVRGERALFGRGRQHGQRDVGVQRPQLHPALPGGSRVRAGESHSPDRRLHRARAACASSASAAVPAKPSTAASATAVTSPASESIAPAAGARCVYSASACTPCTAACAGAPLVPSAVVLSYFSHSWVPARLADAGAVPSTAHGRVISQLVVIPWVH